MIVIYLLPLLCAEVLGIPMPGMYALGGSDILYELYPENPQQSLFEMTGKGSVPVLTFIETDDDYPKSGVDLPPMDESSSTSSSSEELDSTSGDETDQIKKMLDDVIAKLQDTRENLEISGIDKHTSLDVEKSIKDLKKLKHTLKGEPKMGQISIVRKTISISSGKGKPIYKIKSSTTVTPATTTTTSTEAPVNNEGQADREKQLPLFSTAMENHEPESIKLDDTSKTVLQKATWKSSSFV